MSTIHPSLQSSLGGKRVTENPRRAHKNLISPDNIFFNYLKKGTACLKTLPVPVLLLKPSESVTGRGAERRQGLAVRRAWGRKDIFGCEKQARAKDPLFRRELCPRFLRPQKQTKHTNKKKKPCPQRLLCLLESRLEKAKKTVRSNLYGNLLVPVNRG